MDQLQHWVAVGVAAVISGLAVVSAVAYLAKRHLMPVLHRIAAASETPKDDEIFKRVDAYLDAVIQDDEDGDLEDEGQHDA
jgi:hypothetical protein